MSKKAAEKKEAAEARFQAFEGFEPEAPLVESAEAGEEIFSIPLNTWIAGIFQGMKEGTRKNGKYAGSKFSVITLKGKGGKVVSFWGFGLLAHKIKDAKIEEGDTVCFRKEAPPAGSQYYGCSFGFNRQNVPF